MLESRTYSFINEGEPKDIRAIIADLETGEHPLDKFLAGCLAEMYAGSYGTSIVSGTQDANEKRFISLLRIVALRHGGIESFVLTFGHNKGAQRRDLNHLLELTHDLPSDRNSFRILAENATRSVQQQGLMTLAAMQLNESAITGVEIVEVIYPKTYMELMPVPEDYKRDVAFGMAIHYLKNVPFGRGSVTFPVPSH